MLHIQIGRYVLVGALLLILAAIMLAGIPGHSFGADTLRWTRISTTTGDLPAPTSSTEQTAALTLDIDKDGIDDFVIGARLAPGPSMVWYRRTSTGWTKYLIDSAVLPIEAGGTFHDIDSDGDLDIVMGGDYSSRDVWWWENPYPNFEVNTGWTRRYIKNSGATMHHDMQFGDVDGDGAAELIFWNQAIGQNRGDLFLAEIPANPRTASAWSFSSIFAWIDASLLEGLAIGDVDLDGKVDIVGGGRWFKHTSGTSFSAQLIDITQASSRVAIGQLIQGGRPEVVMVPAEAVGPIKMYRWTGTAWQGTSLLDVDVERGHSLEIADVNADGFLDIFNAEMRLNGGNDDAKMRLWLGNGTGTFTTHEIGSGYGNHESKLADLDGDGDLDILGKPFNWSTPRLDIWMNELNPEPCSLSSSRWQRHEIDANQRWTAIFVTSAYINGDTHLDVIAGGDWYANPGSPGGTWTRHAIGSPLNNMAAVYDFDADGDVDILGTSGQGAEAAPVFYWARNDGQGNFSIHNNLDLGSGDFLQGVAVGRYQGTLQVALSWHAANQGIQLLTVPTDPASAQWARTTASSVSQDEEISAGDIDRDGDVDLLLGTKWLENQPALQSDWFDASRSYRVPVTVAADGHPRLDHPFEIEVNFTSLLNEQGKQVALDSLRVVELDAAGVVLSESVAFQFDRGAAFDSAQNAVGTLTILMTGFTAQDATRHYHVYFATVGEPYVPVTVGDRVVVADGFDEGQDTFQITADNIALHYQKAAGGLSSLIDGDGHDWIGFSPTSGSESAGEYRGIPNLVFTGDPSTSLFHPGFSNATSQLVSDGSLKAVVDSVSNNGLWQIRWEFFPRFARMTTLATAGTYWFLYEGVPGGSFDASDLVVRADGTQTLLSEAWEGDLTPAEWVYFADANLGRSLFIARLQDDAIVDSYRPMNNEMTVFGFGRDSINTTGYLSEAGNAFVLGFMDETAYGSAAPNIQGSYAPLVGSLGALEKAAYGGAWTAHVLSNVAGDPDRNRLADVNNDGRLDAVIGYEAIGVAGKLAWYEQGAVSSSIWTEHVIANVIGPMSLDTRDMDADGDIDIVVGEHHPYNPASAKLYIFENADGSGASWTQHVVYTGDEHHDGAHVVDIDGDGDFDIVSIGWVNDKVVIYEHQTDCQTGGGPVSTRTPTVTPTSAAGTPTVTPTSTATPVPATCDVVPTNQIRNPGFETGTGEWFFYTNGSATYTATTNNPAQCTRSAQVAVAASGSNVQLSQIGVSLQSGVRYRLTFWGRASANIGASIHLHKDTSPWGSYGLDQSFSLSPTWQRFSYEFTATGFLGTVSDTRLRLWLTGVGAGQSVWFDDFALVRADAPVPTTTPTPTPSPAAPASIPLPEAGAYGKIHNGDQAHVNQVDYTFGGQVGDVAIAFDAYDVDFADEVDVLVNGVRVMSVPVNPAAAVSGASPDQGDGVLAPTADNAWTGPYYVTLPDALVNDGSRNTLTFSNSYNPPNGFYWGVRNVRFYDELTLPAAGAYGKIHNGDQTYVNQVDYTFGGQVGDVAIAFDAYDVDFADEVDVLVNGVRVMSVPVNPAAAVSGASPDQGDGVLAPTADNAWTGPYYVTLPDALVNDGSRNTLTFSNSYNPPNGFYWGVRNVRLETLTAAARDETRQTRVYLPIAVK